jgi:two-component system, cell cycle sensor histidine kinase and response regulator CckA
VSEMGGPTPEEEQRDKLSVIGQMTTSVAHDIANPLATITASAEAVLTFWSDDQPAHPFDALGQFREDLELIVTEARRAGDIVRHLLQFARMQRNERRPVSLASLIRETTTLARHHLAQHGIKIYAEVSRPRFGSPPWSWVNGDENRLQQVLMNLIINAQQAINSIKRTGSVWVRLRPQGDHHVVLHVADDGPGIPADLHRRVFDPFYTTKGQNEGTGLGLYICASTVGDHQGELTVADRARGGTEFTLRLPVLTITPTDPDAHQVGRPDKPQRPAPNEAGRGRILVVDDEYGIRRSVARYLTRMGFEVTAVDTGLAAVDALSTREYQIVVSDLRMPGLSGEDLFDLLHERFPDMTTRTVFMSGDVMREETREFLARANCPTLQKPYDMAELMTVLDRMSPPRPSHSGTGTDGPNER